MNANIRQRVEQVFDQALSIEGEQRAAFVAEACRDDPSHIRAEVESLLAHYERGRAADFLRKPLACLLGDAETDKDGDISREEGLAAPPGYEIVSELGRGGMGIVYKARQVRLNRFVALKKILDSTYADPKTLVRFLGEAEMVARMQHANIVQIHDVGVHNGQPFFSMEYVEGGSLAEKLNGTPLPYRQAAELVQTLALAVQAAHDAGVVHRDLKPANVLMSAAGIPKIMDFGLAKLLTGDPGLTASGAIVGTPNYMAPEQAQRPSQPIRPACDIYALGAMLYELLTGRPPFKAETALETIQRVLHQEPVPPRRLQPKLPHDLETICVKCLQKDAGKRYASAAALAEDLRRFRAGEPILARPVGKGERLGRWCRRNPWVAGLLAALALVLSGAFVSVTALWLQAEQQRALVGKERDQVLDYRFGLATSFNSLGNLHRGRDHGAAMNAYERARQLLAQLVDEQPAIADYKTHLSRTLCRLGSLQSDTDPAVALRSYEQARQIQTALLDQYPENSIYQGDLGYTCIRLGYLYGFDSGEPEESLRWIGKAVTLWEALARQDPNRHREGLRDAYLVRARVLSRLSRHADALTAWEQVLAVAGERGRATFQAIHAIELAYLGRYDQATAIAEKSAGQTEATSATLYQAACVYAVASAAVRQDRTRPSATRHHLAQRYVALSLELLAKTKAAGHFRSRARLEELEKDKDLDPLHSCAEFQTFLRQLKD